MAATSEQTLKLWEDRVTAHVKVAGSGPALVYLHSGYGLVWDESLDLLAKDFTVYAPEHPGTSAGDPTDKASLQRIGNGAGERARDWLKNAPPIPTPNPLRLD